MNESRTMPESAAPTPLRDRAPWLVLAAAAVLYLWMLGDRPLYAPDEGRYALIGREMLDSGDWVLPTLAGVPYLDKPPLLYWMEASGMAIFGRNDFGARFFLALTGLGGVWLMYLLGSEMYDRRRGVIAASILACSALYAGLSRVLLTDLLLSVAILGAYLGFWRVWKGKRGAIGMWVALAFAMLAKGPVGPALFAFGAVPTWCLSNARPPLSRFRPVLGPVLWAVIALPWTIAIALRVPQYLEFFYWRENLQALASKGIHHAHPWYYAVLCTLAGFLPWSVFLPVALWRGGKEALQGEAGAAGASRVSKLLAGVRAADPALLLSLAWAGTTMTLFTVSVSKLGTYYLPMMPALSILVARCFDRADEPRRTAAGWFGALSLLAIPGVLVASRFDPKITTFGWLFFAAVFSTPVLAAAARLFAIGRPVAAFQAVTLGLAIGMIPGAFATRPFDNKRCIRSMLLKNEAILRSADAILCDRSPVGEVEWYLGLPAIYLGDQHDFSSGRELVDTRHRFLETRDVPGFLKTHPRTILLTLARKRDDVKIDYPLFHEVDFDEGFLLIASPEVK